jgi:hypothetical protein
VSDRRSSRAKRCIRISISIRIRIRIRIERKRAVPDDRGTPAAHGVGWKSARKEHNLRLGDSRRR